ncbi:helix-turn-helix domain-containing protein [Paenibacillus sp. FSL M7-0420]|uniref:helix-turn-helix domain-containing protein n=1 Tax=Paenibacillus sp. FSL M7-0420 TaxID=2921609 RepID=UPI0030F87984
MTTNEFINEIKERIAAELLPATQEVVNQRYADRLKRATLSAEEAAEYIGISKTLLYAMAKARSIPWFSIGAPGSQKPQMRFRLSSLDRWMDEQERLNYDAPSG